MQWCIYYEVDPCIVAMGVGKIEKVEGDTIYVRRSMNHHDPEPYNTAFVKRFENFGDAAEAYFRIKTKGIRLQIMDETKDKFPNEELKWPD